MELLYQCADTGRSCALTVDDLVLTEAPYLSVSNQNELFDRDIARVQGWKGVAVPGHQFVKHLLTVDLHLVDGDLGSVLRVGINLHQVK